MEAVKVRTTPKTAIPEKRSETLAAPAAGTVRGASWWLTRIVVAGTLLVPLAMSHGADAFRFPKELALRLEIIVIVVALAVAWAFRRLDLPRLDTGAWWLRLTAVICAWTIVCALLSTNRLVSVTPTVRVLEFALLLLVTVAVLRGQPVWLAGVILLPAIVNAVVYVLQLLGRWTLFTAAETVDPHLGHTALIGNPNDVGSYFVVPALVATALALSQRRGRAAWAVAAAGLVATTFVTHTVAAIGALAVALAVMFALRLRSWPKTVVALLALALLAGGAFATYRPLRERAVAMRDALARRDYETFSAARVIPFLEAVEMIRDRPLVGVGPGCFAYNFFDYKLRLQERHRWIFRNASGFNFGEVHNDHLQVASETGLPGYALFLTAIAMIALASRSRPDLPPADDAESARRDFVRLLALPVAVSLFVLALAQFPLELVAPTHVYLWAAAMVIAWRPAP
jgi:O-antigen ligase